MLFRDQVDFVRQHIKKNRLRVFMTVLAATIGCAFLIVLASIGFGVQETLRQEILQDQAITEIEVYQGGIDMDVEEIRSVEGIEAIVQRTEFNLISSFHLEDRAIDGRLALTDFVEEKKSNIKLAEGRFPKNNQEIVVGFHFAANLLTKEERADRLEQGEEWDSASAGFKDSILGKKVTMNLQSYEEEQAYPEEWTYTIVGILDNPAKDWIVDTTVLIDNAWLPAIEKVYTAHIDDAEGMTYTTTKIYAASLEKVKTATEKLKEKGYQIYSVSEQLEQIDVFFLAFKIGLIFIGTIAVLISSIGIFNTMTMAVTERTREIGVMKAIGASPKLIRRLFLMESAWIGVIGTILAVIISYIVSYLANLLLPFILSSVLDEGLGDMTLIFSLIPWQLVVIAASISIGVAMISGWRPAKKATKIDVIQALRQEL